MLTENNLNRLYARLQDGEKPDIFDLLELIEMARKTAKYEAAMFAYGEQAHELAAKVVEYERDHAAMETTTRHTPGPWKIQCGGFQQDDGFGISTDNAASKRVSLVAECWPCLILDESHREELLANARLIAAAPELLEACRLAVECIGDESLAAPIRAAITKAGG